MNSNNDGIIISGGSLNAEQVAVGQGAQAIKTTYNLAQELENDDRQELARAIKELLQSLEAHQPDIDDYDEVSQAVQQITEEVQKEQPSKLTLKALLNGVKESVGSIVEIVEKVGLLQKAIAVTTGLALL